MPSFRAQVSAVILLSLTYLLMGCGNKPQEGAATQAGPSPAEVRAIAKEAYIYGFPMVTNYETMYKQAIDTSNKDYRAPFNTIANSVNVATPDDKFVVTPNSDTPYSFLWMDLRAEPIIVTMPKIEKNRYYTGQLVDLYTYNFAYLGTRSYGNDGGTFMIAGPGWKGETPKGDGGDHVLQPLPFAILHLVEFLQVREVRRRIPCNLLGLFQHFGLALHPVFK